MAYQLSNYKDIDASVASIVLKYYQYMNLNDYESAAKILNDNAEKLKPYKIDANSINKIEKGIVDLWNVAALKQTVVITDDLNEPTADYPVNTEWYGAY